MSELEHIATIVTQELAAFEQEYAEQMHSSVELANNVGKYITRHKGKLIRPLLTMLSAGASNGTVDDHIVHMAVALELLHNSSLIHDDVVDNSNLRRGMPTINSYLGNKVAVLCGDLYLAKVMSLLCAYANTAEMAVINRTAIEMSEGELLQQQTCRITNLDEANYIVTIDKKTASLMAACCEIGSISKNNTDYTKQLKEFGVHYGRAFQMHDDMLDYMPMANTGKPYGNDIQEKKITLPLLCFLRQTSESRRNAIMEILQQNTIDEIAATQIVAEVADSEALHEVQEHIDIESALALEQLSILPPSKYKNGLQAMIQLL
ncbi:MAG: polyprenyl synthetase family protein [Bacteroidales bacterium]|nr:polyprenyl synthetase family protein [Bacteroidales bacterium]